MDPGAAYYVLLFSGSESLTSFPFPAVLNFEWWKVHYCASVSSRYWCLVFLKSSFYVKFVSLALCLPECLLKWMKWIMMCSDSKFCQAEKIHQNPGHERIRINIKKVWPLIFFKTFLHFQINGKIEKILKLVAIYPLPDSITKILRFIIVLSFCRDIIHIT